MRSNKLWFCCILAAAAGAAALYPGRARLLSFRDRLERLDDEIAELERENDYLRGRIESAREDPFHLESQAREMGLTREGEKVFRVRFIDNED